MEKDQNKKSLKRLILIVILLITTLIAALYMWSRHGLQEDAQGKVSEPQDFKTQTNTKYNWRLEDMFTNLQAAKDNEKEMISTLSSFKKYKGQLQDSKNYEKAIQAYAKLQIGVEKLNVYANLMRDSDTSNQEVDDFATSVEHLQNQMNDETAFFKQELSTLSKKQLLAYGALEATKASPYVIHDVLYDKDNINPPEVERLLNAYYGLEGNISEPYKTFWNRYDPPVSNRYSEGDYYSKDDKKRYEATKQSMEKAIDASELLASLLEGKIAYDNGLVKIYGYSSDLEMVLSQDGLTPEAYSELKKQTSDNLPILHRYIAYKQKMLKLKRPYEYHDDQLKWYDASSVEFDSAKDMVLSAMKPLGENYGKILKRAFDEQWIDVYPRETKEKGNYTWGAYASHPYVLLNYDDNFDSASTLAHELGHAVHNELTRENQGYETSTNGIFKAEIASTTNEVLFLEAAIKSKDENVRREAKLAYIELIVGTIFEQMKASEFETAIHDAQMKGENLDSSYLNKTWRELNEKYYGKSYELTELDNYGWTELDHLYWNQYMYKYATGLISGFSIAEDLLNKPKSTQEAYLSFLKSGSAKDAVDELSDLHINLESEAAYTKCFSKMNELLSDLEKETENQ